MIDNIPDSEREAHIEEQTARLVAQIEAYERHEAEKQAAVEAVKRFNELEITQPELTGNDLNIHLVDTRSYEEGGYTQVTAKIEHDNHLYYLDMLTTGPLVLSGLNIQRVLDIRLVADDPQVTFESLDVLRHGVPIPSVSYIRG